MAIKIDENIDENMDMVEATDQLIQPAEEKLQSGEQLERGEAGTWVYSTCVRAGMVALRRSNLGQETVAEGIDRAADYIRELDTNTNDE